jgi:hypothetical protein
MSNSFTRRSLIGSLIGGAFGLFTARLESQTNRYDPFGDEFVIVNGWVLTRKDLTEI